ncbi:MAG: 50S ribosomal protein L21 [Candidatus Poribacteria bacterium]|nr:50S ribosomal protein L21 [Candidatus Poribacteria bacterium]
MYAVFASGGKQHRVEVGNLIDVEKLEADVGDSVTFPSVLVVVDDEGQLQAGSPYLENTSVTAEVIQQARSKKTIVFKSKRRKGYKRKLGHRQSFTRVKITAIGAVEEQSDGT